MCLFKKVVDANSTQLAQRVKSFPFTRLNESERRFVTMNCPAVLTKAQVVDRCNPAQTLLRPPGTAQFSPLECQHYTIVWAHGLTPTQAEWERRTPAAPIWVEFRDTKFGPIALLSFTRIHELAPASQL